MPTKLLLDAETGGWAAVELTAGELLQRQQDDADAAIRSAAATTRLAQYNALLDALDTQLLDSQSDEAATLALVAMPTLPQFKTAMVRLYDREQARVRWLKKAVIVLKDAIDPS